MNAPIRREDIDAKVPEAGKSGLRLVEKLPTEEEIARLLSQTLKDSQDFQQIRAEIESRTDSTKKSFQNFEGRGYN